MLLELSGVTVAFGGRQVLDSVSCRVEPGVLTALMGPSGSGKTTLLAVAAGLLQPQHGTVRIGEGRASLHTVQIDWIFQTTPLLGRRSARENVTLGATARGSPRRNALLAADRSLSALGLEAVADSPAYRLSGGEKQRVVVARALASKTQILLADEPTASLDRGAARLVCDALRTVAQRGATVLVATHDRVVSNECDSLLTLQDGQLIVDGVKAPGLRT